MGKVKIKRKSTLIDMTAMSDVTVLLLTFFMLTSTFLQKEPTIVYTPSSVSEEKVPINNLATILVSSADKSGKLEDPNSVEGKIFISFTGDADSTYSSVRLRKDVLQEAVSIYNEKHKNNPVQLTQGQVDAFGDIHMFGVPFRVLPEFLDMEIAERDKMLGNLSDPRVGIPIDGNKERQGNLNDFQIWLQAIYNIAQRYNSEQSDLPEGYVNLYAALMRQGEGIAVKADKDTPFTTVHLVFDNLQTMKLNKFSLMTALKSEDETSH